MRVIRLFLSAVTMVLVAVVSSAVVADDAAVRSGDTAWLMTSTAALAQADSDFENIRQTLENSPLQWNEHVLNRTISTGVSLYREGEKVEETLSRADAGVYQAKDGGRNKVVLVS